MLFAGDFGGINSRKVAVWMGCFWYSLNIAPKVFKGNTYGGVSRLLQQATTMKYFGLCRLISA